MTKLYNNILQSIKEGKKQLAVLIDPDKMPLNRIESFVYKINRSMATHIFLGGSELNDNTTDALAKVIKKQTDLPIILFPGDENQLTSNADGLLFLSLISGRNPDYLIGKHIKAIPKLNTANLEVIPTGYILIENGIETAVERISKTKPLQRKNIELIGHTAKAGEYLGMKLIYLEAGSGATHPVNSEIISTVKSQIKIPVIVGGGIRSKKDLNNTFKAGADLVVIGTAFEKDETFFTQINKPF